MDHKDIFRQRFEFYTEIKNKVEAYLGHANKRLALYKQTHSAELKSLKPKIATTADFFETLKSTQILLMGDFHSEPQSMRSLLRICRKYKSKKLVLALECIYLKHQVVLEKYMAGLISEIDFIRQTSWSKNWNFPFLSVKPLLQWAIQNDVAVHAVNSSDADLNQRDLKIAQNIKKIVNRYPGKLLIVQIGDYHLAQKHLPKEIYKILPKIKLQTVFQSPDEIYFQQMKKHKSVPDFVRFNKQQWAVMAVLPWVKWQNYLLLLESTGANWSDDEVDVTDHVARAVQFISDSLNIQTDLSEISVYVLADFEPASEFVKTDAHLKNKIKTDISDQKSFFVPELKKGYLESFTLNHISRLAAEYLMFKHKIYTKTICDSQKYFLSLIWIEMLSYFFTKIMNPKRKTNTVFDLRSFLISENFDDHGKDVLAIALEQKLKEMNSSVTEFDSKRKKSLAKNKKTYAAAARLLGSIMGEKVFWAFVNKRLKFPAAINFLFQDVYSKSFQVKYYDLIEVIDQWPNSAKSKFDHF